MKKTLIFAVLVGLMLVSLNGWAAEPIVIKLGHGSEAEMRIPGAGRTAGVLALKNYVEAATNGGIKFEIHPNYSLGGTRVMVEQCQTCVIQMVGVYTAIMVPFAPEVAVTQIPYLFKDSQVAWKVMSGPIGEELAQVVKQKTGLRVLAWPEGAGYRNIYTTKPVKSPADLKRMKVRVPENPGLLAMFRGWGAKTVTITWKELYTGLQTGMAKGCDTELYSMYYAKLFEVTDHVTMSRHSYNLHPLLINEEFFQSLSTEYQQILLRGGDLCRQVMNGYSHASEIAVIEVLKKKGVKFYYPNAQELKAFKDLAQKPYIKIITKKIGKETGQQWVDKIFAAAKGAEAEIDQMIARQGK